MIIVTSFILGWLLYLLFILLYNFILHLSKASAYLEYDTELDYTHIIHTKKIKYIKITIILISSTYLYIYISKYYIGNHN